MSWFSSTTTKIESHISTKDRAHEGIHFPTHPNSRSLIFNWAVNTWLLYLLHLEFLLDFLTVLHFVVSCFVFNSNSSSFKHTFSWYCFFHLSSYCCPGCKYDLKPSSNGCTVHACILKWSLPLKEKSLPVKLITAKAQFHYSWPDHTSYFSALITVLDTVFLFSSLCKCTLNKIWKF